MRVLAIDFGTSNTVASVAIDGQAARTLTFDASPLLPSAVYLSTDGTLVVGREAVRQARLDPTRFEPNPKRRIDDGQVLLGDQALDVDDVIAAVLRTVATEVRRQLGGVAPQEVRLTHPAQWGPVRQQILIAAACKAGLGGELVLIPEPVAAAAQFTQLPGRVLAAGRAVAVYDLGGGTFDLAVVGRTGDEFTVLAESGLVDLGGLDFDQAVLDYVGRAASATDPAKWQQILRPTDGPTRRAARALAEDVRIAKETLSQYSQTDVALPDPFPDVHVTRNEFEGLIRANLMRSVETLRSTLRGADLQARALAGIFLVGGSSRLPLVAKLISEHVGVTPVALDQPETAVAMGALVAPSGRRINGQQLGPVPNAPSYSGPNRPAPPVSGPSAVVLGPGSGPVPSPGPIGRPLTSVDPDGEPTTVRARPERPKPSPGPELTASATVEVTRESLAPRTFAPAAAGPSPSVPAPQGSPQWRLPSNPAGPKRSRSVVVIAAVLVVAVATGVVWLILSNRGGAGGNGASPTTTPATSSSQSSVTSQSMSVRAGVLVTASGQSVPGAKVSVGDCVSIDNAQETDLNERRTDCTNQQAVYRVTAISTVNTACDTKEATWAGISGALSGYTLCLIPNLTQGECFRTQKVANTDYEKIDCAQAKTGDSTVVLVKHGTVDVSDCPTGSEAYPFRKRNLLLCFKTV